MEERGRELLKAVGLDHRSDYKPAQLSGGERQRVCVARALLGEPSVIFADEPTAALDSTSGKVVIELLSGLAREQGRAVVIVTHDPRVLPYARRIIHIADGRIESTKEAA